MTTFGEKLGGGDAMSKFRPQYNRGVPKAGACVGAALAGGCRLTDLNLQGTTLDADDLHALVCGLAANSFSPARVNLEGCIGGAHAALYFPELLRDNVVAIESLNLGYNRLGGPATGGPRGAALCAALAEALAGNASLKELDPGSNLLQGAGVATICGALPGPAPSRCSTSRSALRKPTAPTRSRRTSRGPTAR